MNDKILMVLILLFFSLLLIVNGVISKKQNDFLKTKLNNHNRGIIFLDVPSGIEDECYKTCDFFKMHNTGKEPCECMGEIEYTRYSKKEDYWLKRKG